uniref:peptidylprolyl isomerase n=1 Tax=Schistocephalus solidus TaxID=70667 RepID=A0A0X3NYG1_SCHSO
MQADSEVAAPSDPAQTGPDNLEDFTSLTDDRGVLKKIIKEGIKDAHPVDGDTVFVHYVGTYHGGDQHGQKFDSSRDRNERFKFNVGKSEVIKAWDLVIPTMKLGEVCELVALPDYAYKDGKTLKFEIELLEFHGEDVSREQDGTSRMSVLCKGSQVFCPEAGVTVDIHLKGLYEGKVFDERDVQYCVGDYSEVGVPRGVDSAVRKMHAEGKSIVRISKQNSLGEEECAKFGIPPGSNLDYEVTLKSFEKLKSIQNLPSFTEKMEHARNIRSRANEYLKVGKHTLAQDMYSKLLSELLYVITDGVKEKQTLDQEMIAVHLNLALSFLRENNPTGAIENCDKVLDFDASNEKAQFRKGQAFLLRGDVERALVLFKRVMKSHPENTAAAAQVRVCENTLKRVNEQEKRMFRSAFKRLQTTGFSSSEETTKSEAPAAEAPPAEA